MKANILLLICAYLISISVYAKPTGGSCEGHVFDLKSDGKIINYYPLQVLRDNTQVYAKESGSSVVGVLAFRERLTPLEISKSTNSGRVKVKKYDALPDAPALGWVDRHELLCAESPLQLDNGIERKAYINTAAQQKASSSEVPVYTSYEKDFVCKEDKCYLDSLGRFQVYYIVAEDLDNRRFLLSSEYNLTVGAPLIGWIDACDMIPWNTTLQMRPKENVDVLTAQPGILDGLDLSIHNCALNRQDKLIKIDEGIAITGGLSWYKLPYHLPILGIVNGEYQLVAPGRGLADIEGQQNLIEATDNLKSRFEHIDVFFLLDGTRSMQPYINEAKSFTERLVEDLQAHPDYAKAKFRFGFRVYRDSFAGNKGLGEYLALSNDCESTEANTPKQFKQALENVVDSSNNPREKDDAYPEAMFTGIQQALDDMEGCPTEHLKLLFVIGDHGDNAVNPPHSLLNSLNETFPLFTLFFIQTAGAGNSAGFSSINECFNASPIENFDEKEPKHAYQRFQRQACDILESVARHNGIKPQDYYNLYSLNSANVKQFSDRIQENIKKFSNVGKVQKSVTLLRAGHFVRSIVEAGMKEGDVPVVYWKMFEKEACKVLKDVCDQPSYQDVFYMHAPVSDKWQEEIWISDTQLDEWYHILHPLSKISAKKSFEEQKSDFISILKSEIQTLLSLNISDSNNPEKTLYQLLEDRNAVLPMRKQSPLLQYTFSQIRDMEGCEFLRLIQWAADISKLLDDVAGHPTNKFELEYKEYDKELCPGISQEGRNIKRLSHKNAGPFNKDSDKYSYRHDGILSGPIYIIPTNFLP